MPDTTIKKINSNFSPQGAMGQIYLATGTRIGMRLWRNEEAGEGKAAGRRDYETVGYVISGKARLELEGQTVILEPGDSWVVPAGANHRYEVLEQFTAVEATSPPAHIHDRDNPA
ncbi:MAG: cupin domain-containing protein [Vulcanimicrobiota bacterium]